MYCPQCNYTSFDHLPKCPKCTYDWSEQRKQLNLSWLEAPEEQSLQEKHEPSGLKDRQQPSSFGPATSAPDGEEHSAGPAFSNRQHRLNQQEAGQAAGPDYRELIQEEPGEDRAQAASGQRGAGGSGSGEQRAASEDTPEISFPELEDLFASPEGRSATSSQEAGSSASDAGEEIEFVLDFEPEGAEGEISREATPGSKPGDSEEEAAQDELELDISSFIDDLEIEPGDSEDTDSQRSGS